MPDAGLGEEVREENHSYTIEIGCGRTDCYKGIHVGRPVLQCTPCAFVESEPCPELYWCGQQPKQIWFENKVQGGSHAQCHYYGCNYQGKNK